LYYAAGAIFFFRPQENKTLEQRTIMLLIENDPATEPFQKRKSGTGVIPQSESKDAEYAS
jgi:hypothetical protein